MSTKDYVEGKSREKQAILDYLRHVIAASYADRCAEYIKIIDVADCIEADEHWSSFAEATK